MLSCPKSKTKLAPDHIRGPRAGFLCKPAPTARRRQATTVESYSMENRLVEVAEKIKRLEAMANEWHERAQAFNKQGRFNEASKAYAEMHSMLDESGSLAKEVGCVACILGDPACSVIGSMDDRHVSAEELEAYQTLIPVPSWSSATELEGSGGVADRAAGMILGSLVADAAAMGVHWVYDLEALQQLGQEARGTGGQKPQTQLELKPSEPSQQIQTNKGAESSMSRAHLPPPLEFLDPPRSPFYSYSTGRNSPYGEQVLVLLQSLATLRGLHCQQYADSFGSAFGDLFDGYRDVSTKGFLAKHAQGLCPPLTGTHDAQANCIVRVPPLVAGWAGSPELFPAVVRATRVTQDSAAACVWACAAAGVLELLLLKRCSPSEAVEAVAAELEGSSIMRSREEGSSRRAQPNQAVAHASRFNFATPDLAAEVARHLRHVASLAATPPPEAVAQLGRNCHMPNALQTPLHIALHLEHTFRQRRAPGGGQAAWDAPSADALGQMYTEGVRFAISEGGCCASRAAFVGALLCASCGDRGNPVPKSWKERYTQSATVAEHAAALARARQA